MQPIHHGLNLYHRGLQIGKRFHVRCRGDTHFLYGSQVIDVGLIINSHHRPYPVGKKTNLTSGTQFGIQQFQTTGGCISRVRKRLLALFLHFHIQDLKIRVADVGFAPDFQQLWWILCFQPQGYSANRPHVVCDVISLLTISPRQPLNESSFLVNQ